MRQASEASMLALTFPSLAFDNKTKKTLNSVFFCFRAGGGNDGFAIFRYADGLPPYGFIAVR